MSSFYSYLELHDPLSFYSPTTIADRAVDRGSCWKDGDHRLGLGVDYRRAELPSTHLHSIVLA